MAEVIPPLYILGASGYAREVAAYAAALAPGRTIVHVDRNPGEAGVVTPAEYLARMDAGMPGESILGSGRCDIRERMMAEIRPPYATLVHPSAVVLGELGEGCVVAPGAVIAPFARLAPHVLVNYNATVGHDAVIGSLSVIGPGASISGWVTLEEAVYIGAGAIVRERLTVGRGAVVGMGAVVTKDVPPDVIAVGVPAVFKDKSHSGGGWL